MANTDARSLIAAQNARTYVGNVGVVSVPAGNTLAAANEYNAREGSSTATAWPVGGEGGGETPYPTSGQCFPTGR